MADVTFLKRYTSSIRHDTRIYGLAAVRVTEKSMLATAQSFKLGAEPTRVSLTRFSNQFVLRDGNNELTVSTLSGALRHIDATLWQVDDGESDLDISDAEAVKLARKYLQQSGLVPVAEISPLRVTRLRVGTLEKASGKRQERVVDAGVVFQRMIERVPVEGPGGKVIVYLDARKRVTGTQRLWRALGAVKKEVPAARLIAPQQAEDQLQKYWKNAWNGKLEVTDARFGYFELGPAEAQKVLQPAYVMPITLRSPDGRFVMKSVHVVAAAADAVGTLMPPPKAVLPQPLRRG